MHEQEIKIKDLPTHSVILYPRRAQVSRAIENIVLKPGNNEITIIGITPTADESSIKVEGLGSTNTVTNLSVELVPNPDIFEEIYPSDSDISASDTDSEEEISESVQAKVMKTTLAKLKRQHNVQMEIVDSCNASFEKLERLVTMIQKPEPNTIKDVVRAYEFEREFLFKKKDPASHKAEEIQAEIEKCEKELAKMQKPEKKERKRRDVKKSKKKERQDRIGREKSARKQKLKDERSHFWPKKVYKVILNIDSDIRTPSVSTEDLPATEITDLEGSSDSPIVSFRLSYITDAAAWLPRYEVDIDTTTNTGRITYRGEFVNSTSEVWRNAKITLLSSQASFQTLNNKVPSLKPWSVRLQKGGLFGQWGSSAIMLSNQERNNPQNIFEQQQSNIWHILKRSELFGLPGQNKLPSVPIGPNNPFWQHKIPPYGEQAQQQQPQTSIFGSKPANSLFGQPHASGGLFGNTSNGPPPNTFQGFGSSGALPVRPQSGDALFCSSQPFGNSSGFANASSNQAQGVGNLFGSQAPTPQQPQQNASLFGQPARQAQDENQASSSRPSSSSNAGTDTSRQNQNSGSFGEISGSFFGQPAQATQRSSVQPSFSSYQQTQPSSDTNTHTLAPGQLAKHTEGSRLFGNNSQTTSTFGQSTLAQPSSNLFGNPRPTTSVPTASSLFAQVTPISTSGSIPAQPNTAFAFGSISTTQPQPQSRVFPSSLSDSLDSLPLPPTSTSTFTSGFSTTHILPHKQTLSPSYLPHRHTLTTIPLHSSCLTLTRTTIPKLSPVVYLRAKIKNPLPSTSPTSPTSNTSTSTTSTSNPSRSPQKTVTPLPPGPASLTLDGVFLGTTTLPSTAAGSIFSLGLGIDQSIDISYLPPQLKKGEEKAVIQQGIGRLINVGTGSGEKKGERERWVFSRGIIVSLKGRGVDTWSNQEEVQEVEGDREGEKEREKDLISVTVRDQVPISEEERVKVEILTPKGLEGEGDVVENVGVGGDAGVLGMTWDGSGSEEVGAMERLSLKDGKQGKGEGGKNREGDEDWGSATAKMGAQGFVEWDVRLRPGKAVKLELKYAVTFPSGEMIGGG